MTVGEGNAQIQNSPIIAFNKSTENLFIKLRLKYSLISKIIGTDSIIRYSKSL
ncbi:hypothetical protein JCM12296A_11470 [Desulfosarcina cetonica]